MSSLRAQRVSFSFTDAVPVFTEAEFHLTPGWTGLVGANGAGKSTLRRLLAGELRPTGGRLHVEPSPCVLRLCPQSVEERGPGLSGFAFEDSALARRLRGQLRLSPPDLARWETLSPGERRRWPACAPAGRRSGSTSGWPRRGGSRRRRAPAAAPPGG